MSKVLKEKEDRTPSFFNISSLIIDEDYFWFVANNLNGLFQIERASGNLNLVGVIPNEGMFQRQLYFKGLKYNEYLVFAPALAKEIAIYDTKRREFVKLAFEAPRIRSERWSSKRHQFFGINVYKNFVFIIGCYYPGIIRIDMEDFTLLYLDQWVESLERLSLSKTMYFRQASIVEGTKLYIPCSMANAILVYDLETLEFELEMLEQCRVGISDFYVKDDTFWFTPRQGILLGKGKVGDKELVQQEEYVLNIDEPENFREIIVSDNKMYVFFIHNQRLFVFDYLSDKYHFVELTEWKSDVDSGYGIRYQAYSFIHPLEDGLMYFDTVNMQLVIIKKNKVVATYCCQISPNIYREWLKSGYKVAGCMEGEEGSLKEYLAFISRC